MRLEFVQLGLLIWKCWTTETRKIKLFVAEMVAPLFMFLIVVGVRKSLNLRNTQTECHFGAKPMMSAGIVPFLQGLICNANNTCQASKTMGEDTRYPFNKTLVSPGEQMTPLPMSAEIAANNSTSDSFSSGMASVAAFWSTFCDDPFPMATDSSTTTTTTTNNNNNNDKSTENSNGKSSLASSPSDSSNVGKFSTTHCMRRFMAANSNKAHAKNGTANITENSAMLECSRFFCMLQSVTPLWMTLSRLLMGRIVYYPNTTLIENLMFRVEEGLNWPGVLQEAIELAKIYSAIQREQSPFSSSSQINRVRKLLACLFSNAFTSERFEGVASVRELLAKSMSYAANRTLTAAVEFYDADQLQGDRLPNVVRYALRIDPSNLDRTNEVKDRPFNMRVRRNPVTEMPYFLNGFIYLQDVIDKTIIRMQVEQQENDWPESTSPDFADVGTVLQQFPYPCYLDDVFLQVLANQLTLYIVIGWIMVAAVIVKSIVLEKQYKLREVARIMGISPGLHFISWFFFWACLMFVTVLLFLLIVKVGGVFLYASSGVILVFMVVYAFATISFCFFVSSFFNRANVAAIVSGLVYFLTYIVYGGITNANGDSLDLRKMMLSSVLPNVALGFGWQVIANYELTTEGSQFSNFNLPVSDEPADQYTLAHAVAVLLFDTCFYYFMAWYIDYVFPGEFGVPLPFYFVFQPSFWFSDSCQPYHLRCSPDVYWSTTDSQKEQVQQQQQASGSTTEFEQEPTHLPIGCSVNNLVKIYNFGIIQRLRYFIRKLNIASKKRSKNIDGDDDGKTSAKARPAVDNLSVNMFESQITALLGHNGAGKTTTMSIMTGLIPATRGSVTIYGHDVAKELSTVRRMMGFCPQFNVLYDELTVGEHMWFYARIRGHQKERCKQDIEQMLKDTDLTMKRNERAVYLSGGMRRRLSIAVAFIGGSKCVILDEPTAGVDPFARRSIWDLLAKFRSGRTIVLSTHHMDEAEILADRIAIISHGQLQTCGSPFFLKQIHGDGYRLTVVRDAAGFVEKNGSVTANGHASSATTREREVQQAAFVVSSAVLSEADRQHENAITEFVKGQLAPATFRLVQHSGVEIHYQLGYDGLKKFATFFSSLDQAMISLRISSYGLSDCTLEEIFIKIAKTSDDDGLVVKNKDDRHAADANLPPDDREEIEKMRVDALNYKPLVGFRLISRQFYGLLVKRYHRMRRSWKGFIVELLLPVVFVLLGVTIIKVAQYRPGNSPALELVPWLLQPGKQSTRDQRLYTFFSALDQKNDPLKVTDGLAAASVNSDFAGTRCMNPSANYSIENYACLPASVNNNNDSNWLTSERYRQRTCNCTQEGAQHCQSSPPDSNWTMPKYRYLRTSDDVLNLTGFDVSSYIISQFNEIRYNFYGGWSFIMPSPRIGQVLSRWLASVAANPYVPKLFAPGSVVVWFNNKGWLSSVAYNNYVNNMLLRLALSPDGKTANTSYGIVTYNHPLNYTREQFSERLQSAAFIDVMLAIMLILALSFVPASFVMFLIEDRVSDSKHVQMVSGLRPAIYWLANYTWDCINYLVPVGACLVIFVAFGVEAYTEDRSIGALALLFIMYGFATAPMLYPTSLWFDTPSTAFVILACASLLIGTGTTIATWFLDLLYLREHDESLQSTNEVLKVFFFIFPQYCFGRGLLNLALSYRTAQSRAYFLGTDMESHKPLQWDVCGQFLLALFLHNIGWLAVNMLLAYYLPYVTNKASITLGLIRRKLNRSATQDINAPIGRQTTEDALKANNADDPDVAVEQSMILSPSFDAKNYTLIVRKLSKTFETSRGRLTAVDRLSFGVPTGQCFGLLGVNGAGKSTTFNMLTGLLAPSSGTAVIDNYDILKSRNDANKLIGYCPQYDCITPLLSGRENLEFFARLRGVPEKHVKTVAEFNLRRMDLTKYADKAAGAYSGGNKRKLSVAIALTGEPMLILLDEPTAGIDPRARRHLWRAVAGLLRNGQSVILTTHSMDECEALCTRLSIMVNGRFRCLGSPQHLKARFGEGYLLTLRFPVGSSSGQQLQQAAMKQLQRQFEDVALKEMHDTVALYSLGASGKHPVNIGKLFTFLTNPEITASLQICDYSLMQSSLDAVFVTFAQMQRSERLDIAATAEVEPNVQNGGSNTNGETITSM